MATGPVHPGAPKMSRCSSDPTPRKHLLVGFYLSCGNFKCKVVRSLSHSAYERTGDSPPNGTRAQGLGDQPANIVETERRKHDFPRFYSASRIAASVRMIG
jgi:hypothetical protein